MSSRQSELLSRYTNPLARQAAQIQTPDPDELGRVAPEVETPGFFESLGRGAVSGALEPLGFLPPVGALLDRLETPRGSHVGQKFGNALGFLAGFAVPASAAIKVGSLGVKAIGAIRGVKLLEAAETGVHLTTAGKLARGAIAGSLLGAGRDAEDAGQRARHIMTEAALFGVGDVVLPKLFNATVGAAIKGRRSRGLKQVEDAIGEVSENGMVTTNKTAELLGRAEHQAELLFENLDPTNPNVQAARSQLKLGLGRVLREPRYPTEMGVLQDGVRVINAVDSNALDLSDVLENTKGIRSHVAKNKKGQADVLIGGDELSADVWDKMKGEFSKNMETHGRGFIRGQSLLKDGREYVVLGVVDKGTNQGLLRARAIGQGADNVVDVQLDKAYFLDHAAWRAGDPKAGVDLAKHWRQFQVGFDGSEGFRPAFDKYADATGLKGAQRQAALEHFALEQLRALKNTEPEIYNAITKLRKVKPGNHPEGNLAQAASQQGYWIDPVFEAGESRFDLIDVASGNKLPFANEDQVFAYLRSAPRKMDDVFPELADNPLAADFWGMHGSGVQVPHTAIELSQVKLPWWLVGSKAILPQAAWIRMADDAVKESFIEAGLDAAAAPRFFGAFDDLLSGRTAARQFATPFIDELTKIRGGGAFRSGGVRDEMALRVTDGLSLKGKALKDHIAKWGLNDKETKAIGELKGYLGRVFDELPPEFNGIKADDWFENYFPYLRSWEPDVWVQKLREGFKAQGKEVNEQAVEFGRFMERTGLSSDRWESDPWLMAIRYTRTIGAQKHVRAPLEQAKSLIESLPDNTVAPNSAIGVMKKSLKDYVTQSFYGAPEAYYVTRIMTKDVLDNLGIPIEERTFDQVVQTLVGVNYGAFMGFRVGSAVRNLTQTLMTTIPLLGAKYTGTGLKNAFNRAMIEEARSAGALGAQSAAAIMDDVVTKGIAYEAIKRGGKGLGSKAARGALKATDMAQRATRLGLEGQIQIGKMRIPTGLFNRADEFNRVIAYAGAKQKAIDGLNKFYKRQSAGGITPEQNFEQLFDDVGLNIFGQAQKQEFRRLLTTGPGSTMRAAKWFGVQAANDTQWIYQLGAGPSFTSHGVGRLFGQYGTWPMWYASHLLRGATRGTTKDKIRFWGWTAALQGAFGATAASGFMNMSRWTPSSSFAWSGGPYFDIFTDALDIMGGVGSQGQPTVERQMALGRFGLKDEGSGSSLLPTGGLDPRRGHGIDIENPMKLAEGVLSKFTPGYLAFKGAVQGAQLMEQDAVKGTLKALGMPVVMGQAWPRARY